MKFIFIHGSWHGAWCWKLLSDFLDNHGHHVECVDLPGHGENKIPLKNVTYQHYYNHLESILLKNKTPSIVVAHSMSGIVAAPLLEKHPHLISHLYLIASYVPKKGQSLIDMATSFNNTKVHTFLKEDKRTNSHSMSKDGAKRLFYHDCATDLQDWAVKQIQPQPIGPLQTAMQTHFDETHKDKRTYVICEKDLTVNPVSQKEIVKHFPCKTVSIESGHFPFLSKHKELAEILFGD